MKLGWLTIAVGAGLFLSCAGPRVGHTSVPPQTEVARNARAIGVWLTDGSKARFADTVKFETVKTKGLLGTKLLSQAYEGMADRIFQGEGRLRYTEGGFDPEAEFVLVFDRPLVALGAITNETPVTVLGLMETKTLRNLTGPEPIPWEPASLGNNLLTSGPGLRARLGTLQTAHGKTKVTTRFQREDGMEVVHSATLAEVHEAALVPYARAVQAHLKASHDPALRAIRAIDLGAQGKGSAYVNQPGWMVPSALAAVARWPFHSLFAGHLRRGEIPELTRDTMIGSLIRHQRGTGASGEMHVVLTGADRRPLGSGVMTVHASGSVPR